MKILVIPDVHGRTFWKEATNDISNVDKVIFLGDYLDPYFYECINTEDAIKNFKEIIEFKKNNLDKVVLLIGNHDSHYIWLDFMNCSRLNHKKRPEINQIFINDSVLFKLAHIEDNYLFSHAGIYQEWVDNYLEGNTDTLFADDITKIGKSTVQSLQIVDFYRGGGSPVGSCVWADIRDSIKHKLWGDCYQIVGHTQLESEPIINDNIADLDVRRAFIIDTESKEIKDYDNEE